MQNYTKRNRIYISNDITITDNYIVRENDYRYNYLIIRENSHKISTIIPKGGLKRYTFSDDSISKIQDLKGIIEYAKKIELNYFAMIEYLRGIRYSQNNS